MQVRWNFKLQPNQSQKALMDEWLITLRKHRNYMLAERSRSYRSNNLEAEQPVMYAYGAHCDLETRQEYGSCCPLTCAVVKHGVIPERVGSAFSAKAAVMYANGAHCDLETRQEYGSYCPLDSINSELLKTSKAKVVEDKKTGEPKKIPAKTAWDNASGIQSKRTTQLRAESEWFGRINADVLQGNRSKLDAAFAGFWSHQRGFPAFRKAANFNSFQYPPKKYKIEVNRSSNKKRCYSHVYLPGIGRMRYLDSRAIPEDAEQRTVTVLKEADGWYISVLLVTADQLPELNPNPKSAVGVDVGINKLASLSDGSFIENPRFAANKKTRRLMRIRQRRVNRKVKGSKNRGKAGVQVAKLHRKVAQKREAYQWQAAKKIVNTADCVVREDLKIKNMKARCKTKRANGRAMPNGQAAKRGLNRSISDAAWGGIFDKVGWLAAKAGKPVLVVNPAFTSQECSTCDHRSKENRSGEKFVCENCGHIDHADTQASRTIVKRAGLKFVSKDAKILPADSGKVTPYRYDTAPWANGVRMGTAQFKATAPETQSFGPGRLLPTLKSGESPRL